MKRLGMIVLAALCVAMGAAQAQDKYPTKPVKVVVPFGPGSATDIVIRIVGEHMRPILGQPFVIENKPGAFGIIAIEEMARSRPDGYTLQVGNPGTNVLTPIIYKKKMQDRLRQGRRHGDAARRGPARARRHHQGFCAEDLRRVHRLCQGQSRQGALRQRRHRQQQSLRHRSLRQMGGHRARPHPQQGRRRGDHQRSGQRRRPGGAGQCGKLGRRRSRAGSCGRSPSWRTRACPTIRMCRP